LTLDEQLTRLVDGNPTPQAQRTLDCIAADGAARVERRSLFDGLRIPRSHWTVGPNDSPNDVPYTFDTVKLKAGPDIDALARRIGDWFSFAVRIDFNSMASPELIRELHEKTPHDWERIDFIEDPFPASEDWEKLQDELAVNFAADRELCATAKVQICKPAIDLPPTGPAICTSYMDHAIGQLWAAYEAARMSPNETCGLLTDHLFESDDFFDQLSHDETRLMPPSGTGLGFDELLQQLPWKPLT